jgi:hypothetical protein
LSLEELEGVEVELIKYINGLDRSEKRILDKGNNTDSLILVRQWKAILEGLVIDIQKMLYDDKKGHILTQSIEACSLADKASILMRNSNEKDPIYLNLRPIISSVIAISQIICQNSSDKQKITM